MDAGAKRKSPKRSRSPRKRCPAGSRRVGSVCRRTSGSASRSPMSSSYARNVASRQMVRARRGDRAYSDSYVRRLIPNSGVDRAATPGLLGPLRPNGSFGGGQ